MKLLPNKKVVHSQAATIKQNYFALNNTYKKLEFFLIYCWELHQVYNCAVVVEVFVISILTEGKILNILHSTGWNPRKTICNIHNGMILIDCGI